jgi:hypothetical protein
MASWLVAASVASPPTEAAPSLRLVGRSTTVAADRAVQDVLAVGGALRIDGVVRGHIYTVDAELSLSPSAVVLGSVTALGGRLNLSRQGVLPEAVDAVGAERVLLDGAPIAPGVLDGISRAGTRLRWTREGPPEATRGLLRRVLPFRRFTPPATASVEAIDAWRPGPGWTPGPIESLSEAVAIGGALRLRFVSDEVLGARLRRFTGPRGAVDVVAVRLASVASAEALWAEVEAASERLGPRASIKSDLGDGAHWFFTRRDRATWLWQRGPWFLAVDTRLAVEDLAPLQRLGLSEQVLEALAASPAVSEPAAERWAEE